MTDLPAPLTPAPAPEMATTPPVPAVGCAWQPEKQWLEYLPTVRERAKHRHATLTAYWQGVGAGEVSKGEAIELARAVFRQRTGRDVTGRNVRRWLSIIAERGGPDAPLVAYCDDRQVPHVGSRMAPPEDFIAAVRSKCLEPGVGMWSAAVRHFELLWKAGGEVPGLGRARDAHQPFPFTAAQLRKYCPGKAARLQASRGRFAAKAAGLLPAPPISSANLRLRERILFDDHRLDIIALDDLTGRRVSLMGYFALDESTREVLGYLLRETGGVRQTDVEALTAFVLRVAGFAGASAGYATRLKYERVTVAISPAREDFLTRMFPGQIIIERTTMLGGNEAPGTFPTQRSGNFWGKGKIESFFATLDKYVRHIAGQRGNTYQRQPLMLGDLLLAPATITSPRYKRTGSIIEESVLAAAAAQAVHFLAAHDLDAQAPGSAAAQPFPGAFAASQSTGIRGPLPYVSEVNLALQAVIAHHNGLRGHRREGFAQIGVPAENGGLRVVTESSNDKAARLAAELTAAGRSLSRISEADCAALLHKVRRVTVKPGGVRVRIGGVERLYWSENSPAIVAAQRSELGEKTMLALYNPEDARELYLLSNPPSRVPAAAESLPSGEEPVFAEALPLYTAPDAMDETALVERARRVAVSHARVTHEHARTIVPFVAQQTARRERNLEVAEPLRAAVSALRSQAPMIELDASPIGAALASPMQSAERAEMIERLGTDREWQAAEEDDK